MIELVLKEEHVAEDGLWAAFAQFAQIITLRNVEETYIVLGSFKWAVLAWRLSEVQERGRCSGWQLQVEAGCSWQFLHNPEAWEACEATPKLSTHAGLYFKATGGWEPLVQNTLRSGHKRTFAELTLMADYLNVTQPHKNSKKELLKQCQACFGEEFAEACREAAESDNQKAPDADMPDGFVSALSENMEPSEKQDFQDLEKALMRQEQQAERQRWQDMWDEKVADQKAPWQDLPVSF